MNAKKIISLSLVGSMLSYMVFLGTEAQMAQATPSDNDNFNVNLTVNAEISIACPDSSITIPAISGITGGTSNQTETCNVVTNSSGGYTLSVAASTSPAMQYITSSSIYFDDYTTTTTYSFTGSATTSVFGYAVSSTAAVDEFLNNGGSCGSGSSSYSACFKGLETGGHTVVNATAPTSLSGDPTTLNFIAAVGASKNQQQGDYSAGVIVTATAQ